MDDDDHKDDDERVKKRFLQRECGKNMRKLRYVIKLLFL